MKNLSRIPIKLMKDFIIYKKTISVKKYYFYNSFFIILKILLKIIFELYYFFNIFEYCKKSY